MKNNTVVVSKKHVESWTAFCDNNGLKYKLVEKNDKAKTVSYQFQTKEEAVEADNWNQNLHRFDKLEGNIPR